jgi:carbon-monoxide dehydrogenase small subunit
VQIELTVNGTTHKLDVHPMQRLLDVLRVELNYTGCKEGCGEGECGSCSVFLDDRLVNSCLIPALQADGARIRTVEGLENDELGQKLQAAFSDCGGAQCGICTPGMLLAAHQLLQKNPHPSLDEVRVGLSGNLCRCTGYMKIYDSVLKAAEA